MADAIMETLHIMGWLGLILGVLVIVNTVCGIITNLSNGEDFKPKKLFKGLLKALVFYLSSVALSVVFTMLPYVNEMITNAFGVVLLSSELLNTLSSVVVLGIVVTAIVTKAKDAIENITKLSEVSSDSEIITWDVEEPTEDDETEE